PPGVLLLHVLVAFSAASARRFDAKFSGGCPDWCLDYGRPTARRDRPAAAFCPSAKTARRNRGHCPAAQKFSRRNVMALQIGDTAPDFTAETTQGRIRFHDWIGDSWAVLFSHPKDFTPVCTTELGYMARIKPEFDKRNVKVIGLSVDSADDHERWAKDIEETQGEAPNYPIIGDSDFGVSKAYGMLAAEVSGD